MRLSLVYNTRAVLIAIGVIFLSTVTLSYFGYHYTVGRENLAETTLVQSNIRLAHQAVDRIEQKIIDNDRILADMIDVNEPSKWPAMVEAVRKADLNVDQVWILRPDTAVLLYPPYSDSVRPQWNAFRSSFRPAELNLDGLALNQTHHLHKERPEQYFFASYVLKENEKGDRYLVCFQMSFEKILLLLDKYLRDLAPSFYVSVVDYENNGVYQQPVSRSGKYYYESRFPSTLYKWILQVQPRNYTELEAEVRGQRRINLFFIILSMSLVFCSLAIIYVAGRRERQLAQLKEDFISNVSHELKTPLSLIRMFSEILVTGRVRNRDVRRDYYGIIHEESGRMSRLIENLLDFASLERRNKRTRFENTDVERLVRKGLEAYGGQIRKEGFRLVTRIEGVFTPTWADPNALTMALFNLLDNSLKYSGERREIEVSLEQSNGCIRLSVADQGIGIPDSEQEKIFEKFYRASNALGRKIRGNGIGLSITRHVAEMHGGRVWVRSEEGRGSTFVLEIPLRTSPEQTAE